MKQVITRKLNVASLLLGFILSFTFTISSSAQEGDAAKGKSLYNTNCAACHRLDSKMTGPALRNVEERLAEEHGLDRAWLNAWIRNSAGVIASGDAYANQIFEEYGGTAMTAFPTLTDQDISDILAYTAEPAEAPDEGPAGAQVVVQENDGSGNTMILIALAVLFALLAAALILVRRTLTKFAVEKGHQLPEKPDRTPLWRAFVQNQFLVLVSVIFLLLASAYFVYGYLSQVGVDQGYQPIQPIHYSHKIHAGDNQIDCKYCHSSARVSKHSGIPSLNVCMNCHKSINAYNGEETPEYSKEFYTGEIKKLYDAVGWDEANQQYTGKIKTISNGCGVIICDSGYYRFRLNNVWNRFFNRTFTCCHRSGSGTETYVF
jgi:mono/diheme cytochrome c family protein